MSERKEEQQPTVFNMGIATLQRMNFLLDVSCEQFLQRNFISLINTIRTLRITIAPFIKKEELKKINFRLSEINKREWFKFKEGKLFYMKEHWDFIATHFDNLLLEMQIYMKDSGLLMPKSDDPRNAFKRS